MAEGGGRKEEGEDSNQNKSFSVKNHVDFDDKCTVNKSELGELNEPDLGVPLKRDRDRLLVVDEDKVPQLTRDENPFSFRHFLNKDQTSTQDAHGDRRSRERVTFDIPSINSVSTAANVRLVDDNTPQSPLLLEPPNQDRSGKPLQRVGHEFASGLPDFVQDHLIQDNYSAFQDDLGHHIAGNASADPCQSHHNSGMKFHQEIVGGHLPDFTSSSQSNGGCNGCSSGSSDSATNILLVKRNGDVGVSRKTDSVNANSSGSLPDFLSDGPMLSNHADLTASSTSTPRQSRSQRHRAHSQIDDVDDDDGVSQRLLNDRNDLRIKLDEARQRLVADADTIFELRKELDGLRRKEVDEAVALEQIVQQVEANLQSTTQRAVNSESVIAKLKQDVKSLQTEVSRLKAENLSLRSGDNTVVKRAKQASEQIAEATNVAEHQLRQMLSGIESLRLISSVLADVDRVTEDDEGACASGNI